MYKTLKFKSTEFLKAASRKDLQNKTKHNNKKRNYI